MLALLKLSVLDPHLAGRATGPLLLGGAATGGAPRGLFLGGITGCGPPQRRFGTTRSGKLKPHA